MNSPRVSAIVLSGGRGRRFSLQDKGLVELNHKPLVQHVIERLRPQTDQILVNCNRNVDKYQALGFPVTTDSNDRFLGPLAGVSASAALVEEPLCLLCPNDIPLLPNDLVARLITPFLVSPIQIAYPLCHQRHHYLPALVKSEILSTIDSYLNCGKRSIHGWFEQFSVAKVDFSEQEGAFANINSPAALTALGKDV